MVNNIGLWQRASVNSCYHLNEVFTQMPLLLREQTVHETEMQWPSPHIACILLCALPTPLQLHLGHFQVTNAGPHQHYGQG